METPEIKENFSVKQQIEKSLDEKDAVEKIIFGRDTLKELTTEKKSKIPFFSVSSTQVETIEVPDHESIRRDSVSRDTTGIVITEPKLNKTNHDMYYRELKRTYQEDTYAKMAKEPYVEPVIECTDLIIQKLEKRVLELEKFIGFKSDGFSNQMCKCGKIAVRHILSGNECYPPRTNVRAVESSILTPEKIYVCDKYPSCDVEPVIVVEPTKEEIAYDEFTQQVARRAGISIVFFYSRDDPVCKELMADSDSAVWTTIKKMHEKHYAILIMEVDDSDNNKKICDVCDVQTYPTIIKFMNGLHKKFVGDISVHNIERFISSMRF